MMLSIYALSEAVKARDTRHGVEHSLVVECSRWSLLMAFFTGILKLHRGDQAISAPVKKLIRDQSGVVIAEAALILPVFIFVGLGLMDMQWEMKHAANIDYVANEVARCEALRETTPSAPLPCSPSTGGVSPHQYAVNLAQALRINGTSLAISTPACNPGTGVCQVTMQFQFKPVGVWFPMATISRTGTASYVPGP